MGVGRGGLNFSVRRTYYFFKIIKLNEQAMKKIRPPPGPEKNKNPPQALEKNKNPPRPWGVLIFFIARRKRNALFVFIRKG